MILKSCFFKDILTGTNPNFVSGTSGSSGSSGTTMAKNTATTTTTLAPATNTTRANTAPTTTTLPTPAPTTTQLITCFVANNSNLVGGDLYQTLANGPEECCNKCGNARQSGYPCAGWTYQRSVNTCFIKFLNPVIHPLLDINAGADFISGSVTSTSGR